ncbi:MAG: hypothetical protein KDI13_02595 [Alphaproteobacteria bacterium]|nr:hypothetical protein [Alphaproteobacteria bacterium]
MKAIKSYSALEELGRVRLSKNYFMRDFLYSEISNFYGIPNFPDDPELAIAAGHGLCENLLEPLKEQFGQVTIRSAYRSPAVNGYGNKNKLNCASNESNAGHHIWDHRDKNGNMGATACITIPWFYDHFQEEGDWQMLAWWIHDHLPYCSMEFFPKLWAFNLRWSETPERKITSYAKPKGILTKPGMPNFVGGHAGEYECMLDAIKKQL